MRRVLLVAYYFPPSGGPGVQRILKLAKYLPAFGYEPAVLTVRDADYPARDESLLLEVPKGMPVYRSRIFEPYAAYRALTGKRKGAAVDVETIHRAGAKLPFAERVAQGVRGLLFVPDARIGWLPFARREGIRAARTFRADALYSSAPPYTTHLAAMGIAGRMRLPWIAEFRDPWTGFLSTPRRPFPSRQIDRALEGRVLRRADRVVVAWKGIEADLRGKHPAVPGEKFRHVPNGFDPEDFEGVEPRRTGKFTVVYAGSLYGVRNPRAFLAAAADLFDSGDLDPAGVELCFVGRFGAEVREMFRDPRLRGTVREVAYVPHRESVAYLLGAHLLLLVVDEFAGGEEIVPGKVFEYLGAGRPILALARPGAVSAILEETGAGTTVAHDDRAGIARELRRGWEAFRKDPAPAAAGDRGRVLRYSRKTAAGEVAALFDTLLARRERAVETPRDAWNDGRIA